MDLRKGSVVIVSEHNPQLSLFIDFIKNNINCAVSQLSPKDSAASLPDDAVIVIMDAGYLDESHMLIWQEMLAEYDDMCLVALNMQDEAHAAKLLTFMHLSGVFYRHDSLELICKGIDKLLEGHLWMSRTLMTHLIEFFRKQSLNSYRPACGLTQRELEIIGLLGSGASNMQIADGLFVSEHTVKSHLYNIFKKIDVHNRTQAVNWARQNLGAPPPLQKLNNRRRVKECNLESIR
ncbi:DNA-binding response regulator [Halomonas sp. TRM85114]|uniref:LuxR C-terminal-related transcriptional regulator n=1 Tax=Halomonas jincaotanensis TaxID=2810616 RepID=UPI001BD43DDB|nr:LuxR C-terminal-related transcriptional regulator [Halomonas jincaotanensis]MBS9404257.1 DNA-binding response regulator [Halomonas jincaotanensis]